MKSHELTVQKILRCNCKSPSVEEKSVTHSINKRKCDLAPFMDFVV